MQNEDIFVTDTPSDSRNRPLEGLRIIDLTRALAGPYATLLLAGLGAEVIKVEDPRHGDLARENSPYVGREGVVVRKTHDDDVSISHLTRARGKYGVTLNFKKPGAKEVFADLLRDADIVVENFSSGTVDRLGIGYEAARAVNPRIIYCSMSGFGQGVDEGAKAMDVIVQALSGAMYASGAPGEPPVRMGIPMADMLAPVFAVIGILAAVEQRHRTGVGQHIDVSMLGALTSFVAIENWRAMRLAGLPRRTGLTVNRLSPFGVFQCKDGHIAIVATHDPLAEGLLQAMNAKDIQDDERFSSRDGRVAHATELEERINQWSRNLTVAEAVAALEEEGVPVAPVRYPEDALRDPRVVARGETVKATHPLYDIDEDLRTAGIPILFSGAQTGFDDVMPVHVGEHNDRIYRELLGYSAEKLAELRAAGTI